MSLFELADFEETRVEWAPIFDRTIASFGWHWGPDYAVPLHEDGTPITKAEWSGYIASHRCRDCGCAGSFTRGGSHNGGWWLCDACGQIEDITAPWGGDSRNRSGRTLDELRDDQERRRAAYRRAGRR